MRWFSEEDASYTAPWGRADCRHRTVLSDEGVEGSVYGSQIIRGFVGIDLNREAAPDVEILIKFE